MDVSILVKGLESQLGGVLASHVIEVRPEQLLKAYCPILVTVLGIVIEVRPEQLLKAYIAILVIPYGILIELRAEHP